LSALVLVASIVATAHALRHADSAQYAVSPTNTFSGFVSASGPIYKSESFAIAPNVTLDVTVDWDDPTANLNLFAYDPTGKLAGLATSTTKKPEIVHLTNVVGGTWRMSVKAVSGSAHFTATVISTPTTDPSQMGSWSAPVTLPAGIVGVHAVVLRTGKVLLVGGGGGVPAAYVLDPVGLHGTTVNPPDNVFCGGETLLADGRVFFAGGLLAPAPALAAGITATDLFDPTTETWTQGPPMDLGRWYPTTTRLTDGRILITAGRTQVATVLNQEVEVYDPANPAAMTRLLPDAPLDLYPHQWVLPDGRMLATATSGQNSSTVVFDPAAQTWTAWPAHTAVTGRPGGVLLPGPPSGSTKVMVFGGEAPGTTNGVTTTQVFDAANPQAGWSQRAPIPQPRDNMNTVLLPDGTILGVGGTSVGQFSSPQMQTLLYDPATDHWTGLASQALRRGYHSTAVLLPDGRVLSAGDSGSGGGLNTVEIFSPSYLFHGARPTITGAPSTISSGGQFSITTNQPVTRAVLMSPGATTHNDDMNQRHVELAVTPVAGGATVTAPSASVAPSGWYMLFALNASGVPSVATWVHIA
jgi:hypothetical protein